MKTAPVLAYAVVTIMLLGSIGIATACLHPESGQPGVRAQAQEYVVVHARGRQTLLISTQITIPDGATAPQRLSLVTATPSLPDVYETGDPALFDDLYEWFNPSLSSGSGRGDVDGPGGNGVEVLPRVQTGPYGITPIMASGAEGATALNAWLMENGFETLDRALAQSYVDRQWYFLAVDIQPDAADGGIGEGRLPPLQLEFASEDVVLPLKLEAGMGEFAVRSYFFLQGGLPADTGGRYGLESAAAANADLRPASVTTLLEAIAASTGSNAADFQAFELHSDGPLNTDAAPLSGWAEDFSFQAPDADQAPAPEGTGGAMGGEGDPMDGEGGAMATGGMDEMMPAQETEDDGGCSTSPSETPATPWFVACLVLLAARRRR